MTEYESIIKKWGNSYGITVPKEIMREVGLKERAHVLVVLAKPGKVFKKAFGMLKGSRLTGQSVKDLARKELYG